jgi:hypothetical protein
MFEKLLLVYMDCQVYCIGIIILYHKNIYVAYFIYIKDYFYMHYVEYLSKLGNNICIVGFVDGCLCKCQNWNM